MNKRKIKSAMNICRKSGNKSLHESTESNLPQKDYHEAKGNCKSKQKYPQMRFWDYENQLELEI